MLLQLLGCVSESFSAQIREVAQVSPFNQEQRHRRSVFPITQMSALRSCTMLVLVVVSDILILLASLVGTCLYFLRRSFSHREKEHLTASTTLATFARPTAPLQERGGGIDDHDPPVQVESDGGEVHDFPSSTFTMIVPASQADFADGTAAPFASAVFFCVALSFFIHFIPFDTY
jgi:hypothetical protein